MMLINILPFILSMAVVVSDSLEPPRTSLTSGPNCIDETGVSQDTVIRIINDDLKGLDAKGKCYMKCICPEIQICDQYFKIDAKNLLRKVPVQPVKKVIDAAEMCNELEGKDECDTVYTRFNCLMEHVPELKNKKHTNFE